MRTEEKIKKWQPRVLVWTDLTLDNVLEIQRSESVEDLQGILADIFQLEQWKGDLREGILVDLYFYTLHVVKKMRDKTRWTVSSSLVLGTQENNKDLPQVAKENNFTTEQTSAWFSIVKSVHELAVDTPYGNVEPVFEFFKELVLCHSVKRPPYSIELFSVDQVKKLTTYVINTHFKMYKYAFTPKVRLDLSIEYVGLPETPAPSEGEGEDEASGMTDQDLGEPDQSMEEGQAQEEEDTPAVKELKAIINSALSEQVQQLKSSVDQQIKAKDEEIVKRMGISVDSSPPKSPKPKGKKGK